MNAYKSNLYIEVSERLNDYLKLLKELRIDTSYYSGEGNLQTKGSFEEKKL